jgi:hypothetical protein
VPDRNGNTGDGEQIDAPSLRAQELFRTVNEQIERLAAEWQEPDDALIVVCECRKLDCQELVELPRAAYDAVRNEPTRFVIKPGHETAGSDWLLECEPGYYVIEKRGRDVTRFSSLRDAPR